MSIVKIKDQDGHWINVPSLKGEDYVLTEEDRQEIAEKAKEGIGEDYYTKEETDDKFIPREYFGGVQELAENAFWGNHYTAQRVGTLEDNKADKSAVYSKDEADAKFATEEELGEAASGLASSIEDTESRFSSTVNSVANSLSSAISGAYGIANEAKDAAGQAKESVEELEEDISKLNADYEELAKDVKKQIDDSKVSNSTTWSSQKIASELAKLEHTLTVELRTVDGKPVNTSVTIKAEATGEVVEEFTYSNAPISIKLPTDFSFAVTIGENDGYERLENDTFTGIMNHDVTISATFKKGTMYGFHVNENEADPSTRVTYIADAVGYEPARMVYVNNQFSYGSWKNAFFMPRPCMLNHDGTVDYYLDENDYSKKEDGTDSDIANTEYNGNAMMEWGRNGKRIYYKLEEDTTGWNCYIANFKDDDSFKCWSFVNNQDQLIDHFYTPIYQGSLDSNNCLRSLSGQPIMIEKSGTNEIQYAKNNNLGSDVLWYTEVNCDRTLIDLLLYLIGKSTDLQTVFGQGHVSGGSKDVILAETTGSLDDKGLFFGYSNTTSSVKVFGMENWWGCQYRRVAGLMQNGGKAYYKNTYGTSDGSTANGYTTDIIGMIEGSELPDSGYQKAQRIENDTIMSKTVGGGSSTYYCDYYYVNKSAKTYALFGGCSTSGANCGRFVGLRYPVSYASWNVGASLSCKPLAR